jgi:hypothetical protein
MLNNQQIGIGLLMPKPLHDKGFEFDNQLEISRNSY